MVDAVQPVLHWIYTGLRESAAMVWMTWWPLVLGFTLSGFVQSFLPRDALRERLGSTSPRSVATASLLGTISSSCSYAASAMSRALFARGSSWTNTIIFLVASTNLVIGLGIVLYLLLGWQFVAAQFVGGALMILGLSLLTGLFFSATSQSHLRARVTQDLPPEAQVSSPGWRRAFERLVTTGARHRSPWVTSRCCAGNSSPVSSSPGFSRCTCRTSGGRTCFSPA